MLILSIAIGLVLGFILFEMTGIVAGGLVSAGYFALYWDRPSSIALALCVAVGALLLIRLAGAFLPLYGRRRFMVSLLTAFFLQWGLASLLAASEVVMSRTDIVGFLIPGLVAHEMDRQGIGLTLAALLLLTSLTRLALWLVGVL